MKKILITLGVLLSLTLGVFAQTNGSFKSVRFYNVPDSAVFLSTTWAQFIAQYPNSGGMYYNEQSTKFRVFQNGAWGDLGGGGGGGDMILAATQTNTGAKTFLDNTLLMRNVANTNSSRFTNTNTTSRTYPLPNFTGAILASGGTNILTGNTIIDGNNTRNLDIQNVANFSISETSGMNSMSIGAGGFDIQSELLMFNISDGVSTAYMNTDLTISGKEGFYFGNLVGAGIFNAAPIPYTNYPNNSNGDIWYDNITNKFRAYENGVAVNLISGGGGGDMILANTQTVTGGKTFLANAFLLRNPANTFSYTINGAAIVANRTLNLPLIGGTETLISSGSSMTANYIPYGAGNHSLSNSANFQYLTTTANGYSLNGNSVFVGNIPLAYTAGGSSNGITTNAYNIGMNVFGPSGTSVNNTPTGSLFLSGGIAYQDAGNGNGSNITIAGGLGAGTGVTGNIVLDNNNDNIGTGGKIVIKEHTSALAGVATLVAGTVTVNTALVGANTRILYSVQTAGGTQGFLRIASRVNGTSFTITSTSATETSTIYWFMVEPN